MNRSPFDSFQTAVSQCERCPRLREWCQDQADHPPKRHQGERYWAKPVPAFGNWEAELWIVGLAPAAQGANRTGRMFTGDRSGEWLYRALFKAGFCNQPHHDSLNDGLTLLNTYLSAVARCAPPQNKLTPSEIEACRPYLQTEMTSLQNVKVIVSLGRLAFEQVARLYQQKASVPAFAHGVTVALTHPLRHHHPLTLIGSYHPSQQNTFTKRLTEPMFDAIWQEARQILQTD
jgi:uracil-DNA glycosylase